MVLVIPSKAGIQYGDTMLSAIVFATLMTIGPDWAIVDLPYPEVTKPGEKPTPEQLVAQAAAEHVRSRDPKRPVERKLLMSNLRIEGSRAWVRVTDGDRTDTVWLTLRDGVWKVEK